MNLDASAAKRATLEGPFVILSARADCVRVAARGGASEFWMRGAGALHLELARAHSVEFAWVGAEVQIALDFGALAPRVTSRLRSAVLEEALPTLYQGLPLQSFDAGARAFWRKIFFLVRLPGGRRLLGLMARRARRD